MCVWGPGFFRGAVFSCCLSIPKRNIDWETPLGIKRVCLAKVGNDDFGPKSAWEILVRVCAWARLSSWCCLLSIPKRNFDWETPLGSKEYGWQRWGTTISGRNPPRRFWCVGVRVCPAFFVLLSALNSQTKLRVGDTTRNQKSMFGKGGERRFRAEIRLIDSGVCVWACARLFSWCCLQFPNETSIGRHH